ncbi:MAG: CHRD domain-containing protein [Actinobacteria bacterium]|nr:CHRD domain-containing protein [Actinomycetota bacterium]
MRKSLILLAVAGALWLVPGAFAADPPGVKGIGASLSPSGEVPRPNAPKGAGGLFSAILTSDGTASTIAWSLDVSGLSGAASGAHIHFGAKGKAGDIALELCGPCTSGARGKAKLDQKVLDAINAGEAYVNVHTTANPPGEIRGQIAPARAVAAALTSAGEVPPAQNVPAGAKGAFKAIVIAQPDRAVIAWTLTQSGLSGGAQAAHIHLGAAGVAGGVALPLCQPCGASVSGRRSIKASLAAAIGSVPMYVNVHTAANPGGEVRGQLVHATLGVAAWKTALGTIVTDDRGMTLYNFKADQGIQSACYNQCAVFWPPAFVVGTPVAGTGTTASLLGITQRTDGTTMLTYKGQPLYGFLRDTQSGMTTGQGSRGFGAPWWVIDSATGNEIAGA